MSPVRRALEDRERTARMIAEAIEAERERCACIARMVTWSTGQSTGDLVAELIMRGTPCR